MKKITLIFTALTLTLGVMGQENATHKEIGLAFSNLDNFGVSFKTGTNESLWRFSTLLINGSNNKNDYETSERTTNNSGLELKAGKEYRKNIADRFDYRYGMDLSFSYKREKSELINELPDQYDQITTNNRFSYGINFVLGLNYNLNENIILGAEILPAITYSSMNNKQDINDVETTIKSHSINYGLSSKSVLLTLGFRF